MTRTIRTVKDVRDFLGALNTVYLPKRTNERLAAALLYNWQRLIELHGYAPVFHCLRSNYTIGATMRELRTAYRQ